MLDTQFPSSSPPPPPPTHTHTLKANRLSFSPNFQTLAGCSIQQNHLIFSFLGSARRGRGFLAYRGVKEKERMKSRHAHKINAQVVSGVLRSSRKKKEEKKNLFYSLQIITALNVLRGWGWGGGRGWGVLHKVLDLHKFCLSFVNI